MPTGRLEVFAYEDSFPAEYIGPFLQKYPRVEFVPVYYDTDGESLERVLSGYRPDVHGTCVEETLGRLIELNRLQPLDTGRLPAWDRLHPVFRQLPGVTFEGRAYLAPVDSAATGLIYDTVRAPSRIESFAMLFGADLAGRIAIDAKPIIAIQIAALVLGFRDPYDLSSLQLDAVRNFYVDLKQQGRFPILWETHEDLARLYRDGTIVASSGFPGDTRVYQQDGLKVEFVVAKEGPMLWACGYALDAACRNVDAAYAFLNFVLDPESQAGLATRLGFMVSNADARFLVSPDVRRLALLDRPLALEGAILPRPASDPEAWRQTWAAILDA